ncbi:MAG: hypothetical protein ACK5Q5_06860 [Planctomycetaceae bacterium]
MATHLLLLLALSGAPPETSATVSTLVTVPWSETELKAEMRSVLARVRRTSTFDADRDVPDLLGLRAAVLHAKSLSRSVRIESRNRIDYYLTQTLERLQRRRAVLLKPKPRSAKRTGVSAVALRGEDSSLAGGRGEAAQVQQLIALIEAVIQPDSWAVNGGRGTIQYWSPGDALVIRNSQSAHAEIGELLSILEAQQR